MRKLLQYIEKQVKIKTTNSNSFILVNIYFLFDSLVVVNET